MTTTYGTLTYHPLKQQPPVWTVQAQPHVMIRVKRILPRVQQHRTGRVLISDTLDVARDLQWLHERYPLEMTPLTTEVLAERLARWTERQQAIDDILAGHPGGALLMEPARAPRDYQLQFASMFRAVRRLVLADDVGLGKTFEGMLIFAEPNALPALVVTLTHLPQQWLGELAKTWPGLLGHAVTRGTPYDLQAACKGRYPDVVVMNYHKLRGWAHALTGQVKTVLFDECQELRHGTGTDKGCAAAMVAADANYCSGLSVGPDSMVELVGGPFGVGWVGRIEDATSKVAASVNPVRCGSYDLFPVAHLGVRSRGWDGSGFAWKPVRTFIQHPCTKPVTTLRTGSGSLDLTDDHSVYLVAPAELKEARTDEVTQDARLAIDNGLGWECTPEASVNMIEVAVQLRDAQVIVDLSGSNRFDLDMKYYQWQNAHREAIHGTRLPINVYRVNASMLPAPTGVYQSAGRGARRVAPQVRLSRWAYMLGFYLGDGWVCGTRVCFAVDKPRAEEFATYLRQLPDADVDPAIRPMPGASVEVRFGNPVMAAMLRNSLGGARCYEKFIPGEWIVSWPEDARRELLRGLLDSDGSVSRSYGRRYLATTSRSLADSTLSLLRSLGIAGSVSVRQPAPGGVVNGRRINGRRASYQVNWSAHAEAGNHAGNCGNRTRHDWTRGRLHTATVREITKPATPPSMVYDLEMDGHPSFVANGHLVHNSATPVYNRGGEIWNIVDILDKGRLGSREEFLREWGGGTENNGQITVEDPHALGTHLRSSGLLLRRTRKDVHRELPEPIRIRQEVDADPGKIDELAGDALQMAQLVLSTSAKQQDRWTAAGELDLKLRQATGVAKAPYVAEFVRLLLESEERVVLFAWHRAAYAIYLDRLRAFHPVLYTGTESPTQKNANAKAFAEGDSRVLMMSLRAGAGLDGLQESCSVAVFGELDWSPGVLDQCVGRLARDGQEATVAAYYMVSDQGSDPPMEEVLQLKRMQAEPIRDPGAALLSPASGQVDRVKLLAQSVLDRASGKGRTA